MTFTIRQHAGAALVAVALFAGALFEGAFEPIAYAVASIAVWAAVLAGLVSRTLPANPIAPAAAAAGVCLGAAVLLAGASVAWAGDQGRAFEEAVRASAYLGLFVLAACTANQGARGQWIGGLAAGCAAVAALAVLSYLQPGLFGDDGLDELIAGAGSRLSYPIGYWNGLAALLAAGTVLFVHAASRAADPRVRAGALAAVPVALLGIWFTGSRGALLAALVGIAVLLAASPERSRQLGRVAIAAAGSAAAILAAERMQALMDGLDDSTRRAEGDWMTLILVAIVAATGAAALLGERRQFRLRVSRRAAMVAALIAGVALLAAAVAIDPVERFDEFKQPPAAAATPGEAPVREDFGSSGRWQFWGEAVDAFASAPVAGVGAGGYEDYWAQNATVSLFVRNPHSLPLQQFAELGLIGGALLLGFVAALAVAARRWLRAGREGGGADAGVLIALIATAGVAAAIDWSWSIPAVFAPAIVAAGLLAAAAPGPELRRDSYALGLVTVAIAWAAMLAGGLVVVTELKLDQSRGLAADGEIEPAIERAEEARTVQPWSPEPYTQLALLEEARGQIGPSLARLAQAEQRDSGDWRLPLIEFRLQLRRGDEAAAQAAFVRAQKLNTFSPLVSAPP